MYQHLGSNLRRIRLELRLSQKALAASLFPPRRQVEISDIELGRLPSTDDQVRRLVADLADALDVSQAALVLRPARRRSRMRRPARTATGVVPS